MEKYSFEPRKRFYKPVKTELKPIPLVLQKEDIERKYPNISKCRINDGKLSCIMYIQPKPLSPNYKVKIEYKIGGFPKIFVLEPLIKPEKHIYSREYPICLCLYYPKWHEWQTSDFLADTIVPWTYLWLYTYELWLITGKWLYNEAPHDVSDKDRNKYMKGTNI